MSGNFKQTFPASLLQSFIIIKAMVIRCLNFPLSISHERVLSKMFNQKIKCNIIPGRNCILSAQIKSPSFLPLILSFFFFSEFFLVSFLYCPIFSVPADLLRMKEANWSPPHTAHGRLQQLACLGHNFCWLHSAANETGLLLVFNSATCFQVSSQQESFLSASS